VEVGGEDERGVDEGEEEVSEELEEVEEEEVEMEEVVVVVVVDEVVNEDVEVNEERLGYGMNGCVVSVQLGNENTEAEEEGNDGRGKEMSNVVWVKIGGEIGGEEEGGEEEAVELGSRTLVRMRRSW
jgi:hypothetical protein